MSNIQMQQQQQDHFALVRDAAFSGVHEAQVMFGQMLLDGKFVARNPTWALHWFERAARAGNTMAANMVGRCFDQGWGVAPSKALAAAWFRRAAESGLDWGMYNLATLLTLGEGGVLQSRVEAFHWLLKAAHLGHVKSMNLIGGFYEDGWVVRRSRAVARSYYLQAAHGGDFRGQFNIARMLVEDGDEAAAIGWLRRVPETATPAFLVKMKAYLCGSTSAALQCFAQSLDAEAQRNPPAFEVAPC